MKLTRNFADWEYDRGGLFPTWRPGWEEKRRQLAQLSQWLRDLADGPGFVAVAYRSPERNAATPGASKTSQHLTGEAVDLVFWTVSLRSHAARVLRAKREGKAPAFGQIIFYPDKGHVHISLPTLGARNGEVRYHKGGSYPLLTDARRLPLLSAPQRRRALWLGVGIAAVVLILWLALTD